jgi:hypothetical protein
MLNLIRTYISPVQPSIARNTRPRPHKFRSLKRAGQFNKKENSTKHTHARATPRSVLPLSRLTIAAAASPLPSLAGRPSLPHIGAALVSAHTCYSFPGSDSPVSIRDPTKQSCLLATVEDDAALALYLARQPDSAPAVAVPSPLHQSLLLPSAPERPCDPNPSRGQAAAGDGVGIAVRLAAGCSPLPSPSSCTGCFPCPSSAQQRPLL